MMQNAKTCPDHAPTSELRAAHANDSEIHAILEKSAHNENKENKEGKNMSATERKKVTAATSETVAELFHEAIRSYEKALNAGIQLQEESVNLWKNPAHQARLPGGVSGEARVDEGGHFPAGPQAYGGVLSRRSTHEQSDNRSDCENAGRLSGHLAARGTAPRVRSD